MPRQRQTEPHLVWYRGVRAIEYWSGNERRRISTGTANEPSAKQALKDFEAKLERHPLKLTVSAAFDAYEKDRRGKIQDAGRLTEAVKGLRTALGDLRVDQIKQSTWDDYARTRITKPGRHGDPDKHIPRPVSTGTLRREFNVLRAALRLAWKNGYLTKPPAITPPLDSQPRDRYLSKIEARALIDAAITPHVRVFAAIAIFTGARKGSILSLTWDRVRFDTGMIDFQEPDRIITKKRRAIVPITSGLRPILEQAQMAAQSAYVVEYGGFPVPNGLRWSFAKLCQRAGLTWKPTPHHLKHSVASWFAMDKVPIDQAADWLATDPATLRRTYRKFDPTYLRSVMGSLDL